MHNHYSVDLCVIGGGSGGLSVAAGAVQLGLSVVLIEGGEMGGDCLNTGCVPSKSILSIAKNGGSFDEAHAHIRKVIETIAPHDSVERFEGLGVTVLQSYARFIDKNRLITEAGDRVTARFIVIATGSSALIPQIKGLDKNKILTNESIFTLSEKPDHLMIIGGGPIGMEMAAAHSDLGCKVTVIDQTSILAKDDPELVSVIRDALAPKMTLLENTAIESIEHGEVGHKITVTGADGKQSTLLGSHILMATGRAPTVNGLDLNAARIAHSKKGISVNQRLQTNHNHIYAIGDCAEGAPQFTHIAGYHAGIVIRNICFRFPAKTNYKTLPWVTYTSPEIANVGMTESMAIAKHGTDKIRCLTVPMSGIDRAITDDETQGMIKIVGLQKSGKILGVGIVAKDAGEMIAPWSLAISKNMKFKDIAGLILPYPTRSEISKRAAGAWYTDTLFSDKIRKIIQWLQKLPIY